MLHWFGKRLREMQEVRRDERGFTLIELLVVVIIIGILAAIAIPTFLAQRERAWEAAARSDLRNAAAAATTCASDNGGSYVNCASLAQLQAYGFNPSQNVAYTNVAATATRWEATTKHANAAQVFRFSTDGPNAGRVTP